MADPSTTWDSLTNAFGLQQSDVNSLKSSGFTPDQASQLLELSVGTGPTRQGGNLGGGQGSVGGVATIGGSGLSPSTLSTLAGLFQGRGGGQGQGGGTPTLPVGAVDPSQMMVNLGARALNERAVYPPTPGPADPKSGVSSGIGSVGATGATPTTMSAGVPTAADVGLAGTWDDVAKQAGLSPGDITAFKNQGLQPSDVAQKFGVPQSPWSTSPGVFTRAPTVQPTAPTGINPFTAAVQPTGGPVTPGQPFATAPPAPGVNLQAGVPGMMAGGRMPGMGQPAMMGGMMPGMPPGAPSPINMGGLNPTRPGLTPPMRAAIPMAGTPIGAGGGGAAAASPGVAGAITALTTKQQA
jgi:hypothetical protein